MNYIIRKAKAGIIRFLRLGGFLHDPRKDYYYFSEVSSDKPWIYISYIAGVFYHRHDEARLNSHQNQREALAMVDIFNRMGYNVYVQDFNSAKPLPELSNVILVMGHAPNVVRAKNKYDRAISIYYSTGAYAGHANLQIIRMTDKVNRKYNSNLPYQRLVDDTEYEAYEVCDKILAIGSKFTVKTFPEHLQQKITLIHQSTQLTKVLSPILDAPQNEFFFMGSFGNMLKGVPLLIDYFTCHKELTIHIVGSIESDYWELIKDEVSPNILFHGFMNINSEEFFDIVKRCNFIVYPSGTEGMPGAVLNSMKNGLIPIVTPWAAFDEIEDYGFLIKDWTIEAIDEGIEWALSMNIEERVKRKIRCAEFVKDNFNLDVFKYQFESYFTKLLANNNTINSPN